MANELKVAKVLSIKALHAQGWSLRRIARELEINRETVARHLRLESKPAKALTGSRSICAPFQEVIEAKLDQGLSAQRIFQDLVQEHDFFQEIQRIPVTVGPFDTPSS